MEKINKYENICNEIINKFCKKQDIYFEFWVADLVGEVAVFGDYSFNFTDIIRDLKTNQPKGLILQWQIDSIDFYFKNKKSKYRINYYSYCKGVRYEDLKK